MANIYVVKDAYKADVKAFQVDDAYKADIIPVIVNDEYKAKDDLHWYYVDNGYRATELVPEICTRR